MRASRSDWSKSNTLCLRLQHLGSICIQSSISICQVTHLPLCPITPWDNLITWVGLWPLQNVAGDTWFIMGWLQAEHDLTWHLHLLVLSMALCLCVSLNSPRRLLGRNLSNLHQCETSQLSPRHLWGSPWSVALLSLLEMHLPQQLDSFTHDLRELEQEVTAVQPLLFFLSLRGSGFSLPNSSFT